jgi:TolB-like protein/DNA-binding winged helix-turn-helix (wHTH) protein/Flp pilus assembly protein TadD
MSEEIKELYDFGPFRLDASRRLVSRGEQVLPLTSKTFETLLVLVRNHDRVLAKQELMEKLWPDSFVEEVNLAQNVSALRKALGEIPGENLYIATIPGKGYRFVAQVRKVGGADHKIEDEIVVERHIRAQVVIREENEDDTGKPVPQNRTLPAAKGWLVTRPQAAAIGALAACLVAGGVYFWKARPAASTEETGHSLAVLPFQSLAGVPDDEHLGLGVADAVITKLSNLRQLPVRPTDVVIRYADPKVDPMQAARELGVDSLLSGKIQKAGDRIRVTVQLVRVRDGRPLWARTFDEDFTNIFAVEDSISEKVAQALAVNLAVQDKQRLEKHYTENIDAYRNYLEGRYSEFTFTRQGMSKAIEYFSHAIADDPSYALAYAGLADAYTTESDWLLSPREALPKAEAAARKALVFDDNLAEAHGALAHVLLHEWRLAEADQEFHRALSLNPNSIAINFAYVEYLASIGHPEQAIALGYKALTIDPLSPEINSFMAWDFYLKRDYDSCLSLSEKNMQMFPDFWVPHLTAGMCRSVKAQYPEAIEEYHKALTMNPEAGFALAGLGMSYAKSGNRPAARKVLEEMDVTAKQKGSYVSPVYFGLVYDAMGERDKEFAWYEKGYDDQAEWLLWLTLDPIFDGVRGDPRFRQLVQRVGADHSTRPVAVRSSMDGSIRR